jgi:hypothetical protein
MLCIFVTNVKKEPESELRSQRNPKPGFANHAQKA